MTQEKKISVVNDILPKAATNGEILGLAGLPELQSEFDLNLNVPEEYSKVVKLKSYLYAGEQSSSFEPDLSVAVLANVFYQDLCARQSKVIAVEMARNEDFGVEYHTSIFVKLVENYQLASKDMLEALESLMSIEKAEDMFSSAKDVIFVQRFPAFFRYDSWNVADRENAEMRENPDRAFLALMNNDICLGAFWDDRVSLKNQMIREHLQLAIEELQSPDFLGNGMSLQKSLGLDRQAMSFEDKEKFVLHLIDIAEGNESECSGFNFKYDSTILNLLKEKIEKSISDPMNKIKGFLDTSQSDNKKSLAEIVAELGKLKGPSKHGALIK